eukprot:TRINITY_DN7448_c0_g1_i1.p1 TRINITY_DN7448_c0_g1~~TRINITY_DN7448_c0_g1_i1.p1  ORF type:complete len:358 (+),score=37.31 TRINITY_DN7448_c0_g1_i1:624-1697(+)
MEIQPASAASMKPTFPKKLPWASNRLGIRSLGAQGSPSVTFMCSPKFLISPQLLAISTAPTGSSPLTKKTELLIAPDLKASAIPIVLYLFIPKSSAVTITLIELPENQKSCNQNYQKAVMPSVVAGLARSLVGARPEKIVHTALETFKKDVAISFSGAEDVVLIELASRSKLPFRVFALDTGRLHPETYRFFDMVEKHYDIKIEYLFPKSKLVQGLVREKGMFSFYEDGHKECCDIRKVEPLQRQLSTLRAWITGQRIDQSVTRAKLNVVHEDTVFKNADGHSLVKFNPLADLSSREIWEFIQNEGVPFNPLHERGFISIGCEPCTRPVLPGQHERAGRWWWEDSTKKECGLHAPRS